MLWNNNYNSATEEPWNANKAYLEQLMRRCNERDLFANERNYIQWYTSNRTIYSIIHWKYQKMIDTAKKPEEKTKYIEIKENLENLFQQAKTHLNNMSRSKDPNARQLSVIAINQLQDTLDNINFAINDFIVMSGIVNIDGDGRTWQEKIAKELDVEE